MQPREEKSNSFVSIGRDAVVNISSMLNLFDWHSLRLTSRSIYLNLNNYQRLIQQFFPNLYADFVLEKQKQKSYSHYCIAKELKAPSIEDTEEELKTYFVENKKEELKSDKRKLISSESTLFSKQIAAEFKDADYRTRKLLHLFKNGDLNEIKEMGLDAEELLIYEKPQKNQRNVELLQCAWEGKHQPVLDYCYYLHKKSYRTYSNKVNFDLVFALLCNQSMEVERLVDEPKGKGLLYIDFPISIVTNLELAARYGYLNVVIKILENPDIKPQLYDRCLSEAAKHGHIEIVKYFVIHHPIDNMHNLLALSILYNQLTILEYLLPSLKKQIDGPILFNSSLFEAVQGNNIAAIELIFSCSEGMDLKYCAGMIEVALRAKNFTILKLIYQFQKNHPCSDEKNILMVAAEKGHEDLVHYYLEKNDADINFDINAKASDGSTALSCALRGGHFEIANFLIDQGADLRDVMKDGTTLLMVLMRNQSAPIEIVEKIIKENDVDAVDNNGNTALILAAQFDFNNNVKILIEKGANVERSNGEGHSALWYAIRQGNDELVEYICKFYENSETLESEVKKSLLEFQPIFRASSSRLPVECGSFLKILLLMMTYPNVLKACFEEGYEKYIHIKLEDKVHSYFENYLNELQPTHILNSMWKFLITLRNKYEILLASMLFFNFDHDIKKLATVFRQYADLPSIKAKVSESFICAFKFLACKVLEMNCETYVPPVSSMLMLGDGDSSVESKQMESVSDSGISENMPSEVEIPDLVSEAPRVEEANDNQVLNVASPLVSNHKKSFFSGWSCNFSFFACCASDSAIDANMSSPLSHSSRNI